MPFITPEARRITDSIGPQTAGDRCFIAYREMVRRWKISRRWTTAHELYKEMLAKRPYKTMDDAVAEELAWQVFFIKHVMVYENEKAAINGEVE